MQKYGGIAMDIQKNDAIFLRDILTINMIIDYFHFCKQNSFYIIGSDETLLRLYLRVSIGINL